jgi:subtilisin family serine protease
MKTKLHAFLLKTTFLLFTTIILGTAFSQTAYKDYQDGKIWIRLKNDKVLTQRATIKNGAEKIDLNNLKLATMPFFRSIFTSHSVTRLAQPFPKAFSSDDLMHTYLIEFSDFSNVDAFISELKESNAVEYAEKVPLNKITLTPNDPFYNSSQMWGLFQINAGTAWNVSTGSSSIVVAITDNAIEIAHPDLVNQLWVNTGEIPGNNIDDDNNGYIDDVNGFDVGDNDGDPSPLTSSWDHGTHVSGTIGAESNNNIGVASIGYGVSIMAVKSTPDASGSNSVNDGYNGIYYATINGADVINCSWGGTGFSTTGQNIVNFAWNSGSIVVAAAGNDGTDNDATPHYPSNYSNAIAVASSTTGDVKSSFSNYGTNSIDITAPGSNIASTVPYGNYGYMSGTSMASPMVSGLLGLMKSLNPGMPNQDLINCMYSTADNINTANPSYIGELGAGRINAFAAMNCVGATLNNPPVADFVANFTTLNAGGTVIFTDQTTFSPNAWTWNFDNQGLGGVTPATANTQGPHNVTYNNPGVYEVRLTASNANGSDVMTKTGYITVNALGACSPLNLDDPTFGSLASIHVGWTPSLYTLTPATDGYVAGTNATGDLAKAEYFPGAMVGSLQYVTGVYVWYGKAYAANPSTTIDVNVYDATGGTVGAIIGSETVAMSTISNGSIRYYEFNPPLNVPASGEIAVGVDYSNLNWSTDTLAIVTNNSAETSVSSGFEKLANGTWQNYSVRFGGTTWSHYIFPELTSAPATINLSASPTTICEGGIVNYDATGSTYSDTLLWNFAGTTPNSSNNVMENVIYNTAGTYKSYLQVIGGGCSNYRIDSVTITVNPTPSPSISATNDTICSGSSVTLNGSGATGFAWTPGGSTSTSINVSPTSNTTYNLAGTTAGCTGNASKTIYVDNPATALAVSSPSTICVNENVNFDGTTSTGANNYSWTFGQGSPSTASSTSPLPIVSFGAGGTHSYSLQVSNSCGNNTFNGSVTVDALTVPTFTQVSPICTGNTLSPLPLTSNNGISGAWSPALDNANTTQYTFTPTSGQCSDIATMTITVNLCTGINQLSNGEFKIYPNPADNFVIVELGSTLVNKVTLTDVQGQIIYSSTNTKDVQKLKIDLTQVSKGVYFLQLENNEDIKTYKVLKQ